MKGRRLGLNHKTRSPGRPRADWSKHLDMSYPRVMRGSSRLPQKSFLGQQRCFCVPVFVYRSFHGATERFDWLIVSQQGDSPIGLLITSRTDNFPLFARPRKESYGFEPPQKVQDSWQNCKDSGEILAEVKIDCAISAANSRLSPRQTTGYFFSRFWGLIKCVDTINARFFPGRLRRPEPTSHSR